MKKIYCDDCGKEIEFPLPPGTTLESYVMNVDGELRVVCEEYCDSNYKWCDIHECYHPTDFDMHPCRHLLWSEVTDGWVGAGNAENPNNARHGVWRLCDKYGSRFARDLREAMIRSDYSTGTFDGDELHGVELRGRYYGSLKAEDYPAVYHPLQTLPPIWKDWADGNPRFFDRLSPEAEEIPVPWRWHQAITAGAYWVSAVRDWRVNYSGLPIHPMWLLEKDQSPESEDGGPIWYRDEKAILGIEWISTLEPGFTREAELRTARWVAGWQMRHFPRVPDPRQWDWRIALRRIQWKVLAFAYRQNWINTRFS